MTASNKAAVEEMDALVEEIKATCENPFANAKKWNDDERETYLKGLRDEPCPLWMDEEEIAEARRKGNKKLKALEEMVYDQDPDVLADQFKDQGNSYFKRGITCYDAAIRCYTDGLVQIEKAIQQVERDIIAANDEDAGKSASKDDACSDDDDEDDEEDVDPVEKKKELLKLWGVLLTNRAAVHLKKKNYRTTILDCQEAVKIDPSNIKAYYRAAKASQGLQRYKRGLQILAQGEASVLGGHPSFTKLRLKLEAQRREQTLEKKKKKAERAKQKEEARILAKALEQRKVQLRPILFEAMRQYEGKPSLDASGTMHWPLLFLYEEHSQSDFIRDTTEHDMLHAHLEEMFPCEADLKGNGRQGVSLAPWDRERSYTLERLVVFLRLRCSSLQHADASEQRWLRLHVGTTIAQILRHSKCEVPGFPVFWVLARDTEYHRKFLAKWDGQIDDLKPRATV